MLSDPAFVSPLSLVRKKVAGILVVSAATALFQRAAPSPVGMSLHSLAMAGAIGALINPYKGGEAQHLFTLFWPSILPSCTSQQPSYPVLSLPYNTT